MQVLDWSKLKALADDKINRTEKLKFVLGRVEIIVAKGENAGYQHFLLFPQCFLPFPKQTLTFYTHLNCRLQVLSIWTCLKFCDLVKS